MRADGLGKLISSSEIYCDGGTCHVRSTAASLANIATQAADTMSWEAPCRHSDIQGRAEIGAQAPVPVRAVGVGDGLADAGETSVLCGPIAPTTFASGCESVPD